MEKLGNADDFHPLLKVLSMKRLKNWPFASSLLGKYHHGLRCIIAFAA
jgi:hypothetical protein